MAEGETIYELTDGVATVTINRPENRNSLNAAVVEGLSDAVARTAADPDAGVLVITGAGERAFCSGADLSAMFPESGTGSRAGDSVVTHESRGAIPRLFLDMYAMGKPTIAKVRGYCLAGGFGLAMACDLVIAADDAVFGTPEIDVGLWPYMITVPLLRSMPPKTALELMMTGRRVGATEAKELGFVNRTVPADELDAAVAETARALASKSPQAMRLGRSSFYRSMGMAPEEALPYLQAMLTVTVSSEDAAEGIAAFIEKRPPSWGRG